MNTIVSKAGSLKDLKEAIENFKQLCEKKDPFWEQAIKECLLEYALTKDLPDDENFVINRANLLLHSGLYHAAQRRLDKIVEGLNKKDSLI